MQPVTIKSKDYLLTLQIIQVVLLILIVLIPLTTWLIASNWALSLLPVVLLGWVVNRKRLLVQKHRTLRFYPSAEVTSLHEFNQTTKTDLKYTVEGHWHMSGCLMIKLKAIQAGPVMDVLVLRSVVGAHIFSMLLVHLQSFDSDIKQIS